MGTLPTTGTVLVANPGADVYGSDLQLLESVAALREHGWRVVVATPETGPLAARLAGVGAELELLPFPVLRRSAATPAGLADLVAAGARAVPRMRRLVAEVGADVVYVNTVTLPWWLLAARLAGVPSLCHVHEAEQRDRRLVQQLLAAPLFAASTAVVNSRTTQEALCAVLPRLRRRTLLVANGVPGPDQHPRLARRGGPFRLVVVGRLSPRKAPDVALEAVALLRRAGRDVRLELCGTAVPGQEAFRHRLEQRASAPDLAGAVRLCGYAAPVWPALERADALVAPSLGESFGNAVVEAQLACRPVVATAVQGHLETVRDGESGLLVPVRDPAALAAALTRLLDEPGLAETLAVAGMCSARESFGVERYRAEIAEVVAGLTLGARRPRGRQVGTAVASAAGQDAAQA